MGATMSAFIPSYTKSPITSKIFSLELFSKASSVYSLIRLNFDTVSVECGAHA